MNCSGVPPSDLGARNGHLAPCPAYPICISSERSDPRHAIEPLPYASPISEAMAEMQEIILWMKRARIVQKIDNYIHAEFTSAISKFADDIEFY